MPVAWIQDLGGRATFPGGDGEAAMLSPQWDFVLPDLLLPRRCGSGSAWESGGMCTGDGRRRASASSRCLLLRSGKRGVKAVAPVFFLDGVDGKQRSHALRSDGGFPRPMSPKDNGAAARSSLLLRSTKEQISDGIFSELGSSVFLLLPFRRRRRRLGLDVVWLCSRIQKIPVVFFFFLGFFVYFPGFADVWIFPEIGGAAEVRLYRRTSHGGALVDVATLELVAPPRLLEVGDDPEPPVQEADGDLGRGAGLYLALLQDGQVVDVARLLPYAGEAAGEEDHAQDYFLTGSNTSNDDCLARWTRDDRVFQYGKGSSDSDRDHEKGNIDEDDWIGRSTRHDRVIEYWKSNTNRDRDHGNRSSSSSCDDDDWLALPTRQRSKEQGKSSSSSKEHGKSSRNKHVKFNGEEQVDNTSDDDWLARPTRRRSSSSDRGSTEADDDDGDKEENKSCEDKNCRGLASSYGWAEDAFSAPGALRMWQDPSKLSSSSEDNDTEREDNSDKGSSADGDEDEEDNETYDALSFPGIDDDINDGGSDNADAAAADESKSQSVELKIRLWLAKNHLRIKIFICRKWISTTVYRLTWTNHQELEELFVSSFKMDIGAPVATNTVFRIRDCVMDFEVLMIDTPGELVSELQPSIRDFKFCQKLGGEAECRVFKVLSKGRMFALKTIRLDECCSTEPREVDIISSLKDKRVMSFYQAWKEPWSYKKRPIADFLFIQLELCKSTLKHQLLPENVESIVDRLFLFEEMVKSLKTIHSELIVHRDLKPDNIFFGADMGVRIGDFGDACIGRDEFGACGGTPNLGTKNYSAPELGTAQKITEKADIYPMGVMFIELFTKFLTEMDKLEVLTNLSKDGLPDDWVGDSEGTRGLVERMVASEPAYRPSTVEILDYIQHQFYVCGR